MTQVNLRQGVVVPKNRSNTLVEVNGNINLIASDTIRVIFAHGTATYLIEETGIVVAAWEGPFSDTRSYWFFWEISTETGQFSRGITQVEPSFGTTLPSSPVLDQHFFDKTDNFMKVWNGGVWVQKIRVFAGSRINGLLSPVASGSQADIYGPVTANELRFYKVGKPIRRELEDGNFEFITFTGDPIVDVGQLDNFKLGRVDLSVVAAEDILKNHAVVLNDNGELITGSSGNADKEILGIIEVAVTTGDKKNVVTRGYVQDRDWSFQEPPLTPLYVGLNGEVTTTIPTSTTIQKIGYIISTNTIFIAVGPQIIIIGTPTPTVTASVTPTATPTSTVTPTVTPSVTATVTPTLTPTNTVTPSITATVTPTVTTTATPTPTITPSTSASGNDYENQLSAVASHYWNFSELTDGEGPYVDSGASPINLTIFTTGLLNDNLPGAVRGDPFEKAVWKTGSSGWLTNSTGVASHSIGTIGTWVFIGDLSSLSVDAQIMGQFWNNNAALEFEIAVTSLGAVKCKADAASGGSNTSTSANGVITSGKWHFIVATQAGDGSGIHILVDGVDLSVTTSVISGTEGFTLDSWFDTIEASFGGLTITEFRVFASGSIGSFNVGLQFPFLNVNTALSASTILNLFNSIGAAFADSDFYETVRSKIDPEIWITGQDHISPENIAQIGKSETRFTENGTVVSGQVGPLTAAGATNYVNEGMLFNSISDSIVSQDAPSLLNVWENDTVGTMIIWVRLTSTGAERRISGGGGNNSNQFILGHDASDNPFFEMEVNNVVYRQTVNGFTLADSTWYKFAIVQDGAGVDFYIDGVLFDGADITETGAGDRTWWITDMDAFNAMDEWRVGIGQGGSGVGFLGTVSQIMYSKVAASAANILLVHDASLGNF